MKALKITQYKSKLSDSEIIYRILNGEKEMYELLMRRNNQKLFRVIRGYIKVSDDVEDIMQNTYLKAYEKLYQFKHTSEFSTWLIRIGINEAIATLKKKGKVLSIELAQDYYNENPINPMRKQHHLNPEEIIIQQEVKHFIEKAIDILDSKYKVVFIMKEVEKMSIQEISFCLDLTASNVKVRLHRAKALLKDKLFELHQNQDIFEFGFTRCDNLVERVMNKI